MELEGKSVHRDELMDTTREPGGKQSDEPEEGRGEERTEGLEKVKDVKQSPERVIKQEVEEEERMKGSKKKHISSFFGDLFFLFTRPCLCS